MTDSICMMLSQSPSRAEARAKPCTGPLYLFTTRDRACMRPLLFLLNQDHQLKSSPAGHILYLVGDSDACVEIDSTPLLKPSSRGPLRGGSQDMATTYKMGHLDDRSNSFSKCMSSIQFCPNISAMMINLEIGNRTTSAAVRHFRMIFLVVHGEKWLD